MSTDARHAAGPGEPARAAAWSLETDDLDELSQAFARWDQRFEQLDGGRFRGRLWLAELGGVQLWTVATNRVVRARGSRAADSFVFSPVSGRTAGSYWRGRELAPGMVNVLAPDAEMDHRTCREYENTSLVVHRGSLERVATAVLGVGLDRLLCGERALEIGACRASALSDRLRDAVLALTPPRDGAAAALRSAADPGDLVAHLVETLAAGRVVDPSRTTAGQRREAVRRVEDHVRAHPERRLGILQLCELSGVSRRTLHYAFLEVTGCTPKDFIKAIKLNAARRELRAIGPGPGHVERVARRYGFDRPGNFAADFHRLFGELPSRSLRPRPR